MPHTTRSKTSPWTSRNVATGVVVTGLLAGSGLGYFLIAQPDTASGRSAAHAGSRSSSSSSTGTPVRHAPQRPTRVVNLSLGATAEASVAAAPAAADAAGTVVRYTPHNLIDGDLSTAWRTRGSATGVRFTITLRRAAKITRLAVTNGYTKRDPTSGVDRYRQERRITAIDWSVGGGPAHRATLRDGEERLQHIAIPSTQGSSVTVTVDSTTAPGDAEFDYTAISEIDVLGSES